MTLGFEDGTEALICFILEWNWTYSSTVWHFSFIKELKTLYSSKENQKFCVTYLFVEFTFSKARQEQLVSYGIVFQTCPLVWNANTYIQLEILVTQHGINEINVIRIMLVLNQGKICWLLTLVSHKSFTSKIIC